MFCWLLYKLYIPQVKVWCTKQEASVLNIDMKANICSVKYNPGSSYHVAVSSSQFLTLWTVDIKQMIFIYEFHLSVSYPSDLQVGSADHHIHYYDLRNISQPLHIFSGHRKAVSYVKFLSNNELASASTDSTLRLWDVKDNIPVSYNADFSLIYEAIICALNSVIPCFYKFSVAHI